MKSKSLIKMISYQVQFQNYHIFKEKHSKIFKY